MSKKSRKKITLGRVENVKNGKVADSIKTLSSVAGTEPLVPGILVIILWAISLALPNLVYSGVNFADTLHILKWTVAAVPVALAALVAGWRLLTGRAELKLDLFAIVWSLLLALCLVQTFWVKPSSLTGYAHEMACFLAVWAFYVLTVQSFPSGGLRPILWLANINAALNVFFAELQFRQLNDLSFLKGTQLEFLMPLQSLILPTPRCYIGNTAQQNMFGLWMAICLMNCIYLFITAKDIRSRKGIAATAANFVLLVITSWGLWNSTSRSGILSFFAGLAVIAFFALMEKFYNRKQTSEERLHGQSFKPVSLWRLGMVLVVFAVVLIGTMAAMRTQSMGLIQKTGDMIMNPQTVGGRIGIWTTSKSMFLEHPMGVSVGQFKWHYMAAQRAGFARLADSDGIPPAWYTWQYTHWAHNEFLQWFCEAGLLGGTLLLILYGLWLGGLTNRVFLSAGQTCKRVVRWLLPSIGLVTVLLLDLTLFTGLQPLIRASCDVCIISAFALMLVLADRGVFAGKASDSDSGDSTVFAPEIIWGCALVVLVSFNAFWTRPFHRIENILWLTLAFALSNRELFTGKLGVKLSFTKRFTRLIGAVFMACAVAGVIYLGSGITGNYELRQALSTQSAEPQRHYLELSMRHPITYESAMRNLGYHYLQLGEQTNNIEMMNYGFNLLWTHFLHESHTEDFGQVLNWAQKFQFEPIILELASYMRPGSYQLLRQRATNSNGEQLDALIVQTIQPEDSK